MAFAKKQKIATCDSRPQKHKIVLREEKVATLKALNTPESRKVLKQMNDKVYRGSRSNLTDWYAPKGKKVSAKP